MMNPTVDRRAFDKKKVSKLNSNTNGTRWTCYNPCLVCTVPLSRKFLISLQKDTFWTEDGPKVTIPGGKTVISLYKSSKGP
jgi:hypothetical protein